VSGYFATVDLRIGIPFNNDAGISFSFSFVVANFAFFDNWICIPVNTNTVLLVVVDVTVGENTRGGILNYYTA
jgi:hypothetical protein